MLITCCKSRKVEEINMKESERMKSYSLYFNILNTNMRRLFISVWEIQIVTPKLWTKGLTIHSHIGL